MCVYDTEKAQPVTTAMTHQDEVSLIGGQHKHRDVLVSQWSDDRLGDLCNTDGLGAGEAATTRHHIQSQPGGISHAQVLGGGQLCKGWAIGMIVLVTCVGLGIPRPDQAMLER